MTPEENVDINNSKLAYAVGMYVKANLAINIKTSDFYTGGLDGSGNLYSESKTIQLLWNGEVIDEVYL